MLTDSMHDGPSSITRKAEPPTICKYGIASDAAAPSTAVPAKMESCRRRFFGSHLRDWAWRRI